MTLRYTVRSLARGLTYSLNSLNLKANLMRDLRAQTLVARASSNFLNSSPNAALDKNIWWRYRKYPPNADSITATYLWIDGTGEHLRLKDRILPAKPKTPEELPTWEYDGSSTYQSQGENSDVTLMPRAIYSDPFKPGKDDIIVMCETYFDGKPTKTNQRHCFELAMKEVSEHKPWFGVEQEYVLLDADGRPFGWPPGGFPRPQGSYYCGVGGGQVYARDIAESHAAACLYAGIKFGGTNAEVMPSQWEYQTGPEEGIKAADDVWVSRYILYRIAEGFGLDVTLDPKPVTGPWNGSGAHTNFSTKAMREEGGMKAIEKAIERLSKKQKEHIMVYDPNGGKDNFRRLLGRLETSSFDEFSWGVAHRGSSVRIPRGVATRGFGYLEDRRPSSNMDPYAVMNALVRTCIMDED